MDERPQAQQDEHVREDLSQRLRWGGVGRGQQQQEADEDDETAGRQAVAAKAERDIELAIPRLN